jgi:chemotaxis protein MotB
MFKKTTLSWLLLSVIVFSSCVSSKKYKAATTDAQTAKMANEDLRKKDSALQAQLNDAISSQKLLSDERDRYQKEADAAKASLKSLQGDLDEYTNSVDELQKKTADKMADYSNRGVEVTTKDGQVHVSFTDDLMFKKGSAKISKNGETALGTLASVLSENPNLKVLIVGHTDDRAGHGADNWTLSTERANNVVRMLKTMKVDPARLTAAGQAQYNAIGDNTTAEGRAQNRRTDIILIPESYKGFNKK